MHGVHASDALFMKSAMYQFVTTAAALQLFDLVEHCITLNGGDGSHLQRSLVQARGHEVGAAACALCCWP
jgi:hypothetical protein